MNKQKPAGDEFRWVHLLKLVRDCPSTLIGDDGEEIRIAENTRLVMWCLAMHADETCETFVKRDTIMRECALTHNPLDRVLADLKRAGLLESTPRFNPATKVRRSDIRKLNRRRLEREAKRGSEEDNCADVLKILAQGKQEGVAFGPILASDVVQMKSCLERLSLMMRKPIPLRMWEEVSAADQDGQAMVMLQVFRQKAAVT
jgi:hypothetical protein